MQLEKIKWIRLSPGVLSIQPEQKFCLKKENDELVLPVPQVFIVLKGQETLLISRLSLGNPRTHSENINAHIRQGNIHVFNDFSGIQSRYLKR